MEKTEEHCQKIIITNKNLRIKEQFDHTREFLDRYYNLIQDAIAWNSFEEEFYILVTKQIEDQLDSIIKLNDLVEYNYVMLMRFLEKEKEIAQGKNASNK